jgi:hypothetical protein
MFTRRVVGSGPAERGFVCGDASQSYLTGQLLDPSNRDDRFAATVVELMRQRPAAQSRATSTSRAERSWRRWLSPSFPSWE